jgi:hypothetical protein
MSFVPASIHVLSGQSQIAEEAEKLQAMETCPQERNRQKKRLERLVDEVWNRNIIKPFDWVSAIVKERGVELRINGGHSTYLVREMGVPQNAHVVRTRFVCDTMEDATKLWMTYDTKVSVRSVDENNNIISGSIPELAALEDQKAVKSIYAGVAFDVYGDVGVVSTVRLDLVRKNIPAVLFVYNILRGLTPDSRRLRGSLLMRRCTIAAMLKMYRISPEKTKEFWTLVRDGSHPDSSSPTRVLQIYLVEARSRKARSSTTKYGDREILAKCIHGWNAFLEGKKTDLKYFKDAPLPPCKSPEPPKGQSSEALFA